MHQRNAHQPSPKSPLSASTSSSPIGNMPEPFLLPSLYEVCGSECPIWINPSPYKSHPTITYAFFGDCTRNLSTTSSARLAARLQSFRDRLAAQLQLFHVGRVLGTSINKVVEPSHKVLINIVETDGIMRAALASEFEVDRVEGVPSTESWQKLIFQGVGQTEPAAAMMDCHREESISHPRVGARSG